MHIMASESNSKFAIYLRPSFALPCFSFGKSSWVYHSFGTREVPDVSASFLSLSKFPKCEYSLRSLHGVSEALIVGVTV